MGKHFSAMLEYCCVGTLSLWLPSLWDASGKYFFLLTVVIHTGKYFGYDGQFAVYEDFDGDTSCSSQCCPYLVLALSRSGHHQEQQH
jgi:hypothetical protein